MNLYLIICILYLFLSTSFTNCSLWLSLTTLSSWFFLVSLFLPLYLFQQIQILKILSCYYICILTLLIFFAFICINSFFLSPAQYASHSNMFLIDICWHFIQYVLNIFADTYLFLYNDWLVFHFAFLCTKCINNIRQMNNSFSIRMSDEFVSDLHFVFSTFATSHSLCRLLFLPCSLILLLYPFYQFIPWNNVIAISAFKYCILQFNNSKMRLNWFCCEVVSDLHFISSLK